MSVHRRERPVSHMTLDAGLIALSFPRSCAGSDPQDALLMVRRAGCCDDWLIAYPYFGQTLCGRAEFRLDGEVHKLPHGSYDAVLVVDCTECASIRLVKPFCPAVSVAGVEASHYTAPPAPGEAIEGVEPVFETYYGFTAVTTCVLSAADGFVSITPAIPLPTTSPLPELVLSDGVNREVVTLKSASADGKTLSIKRGAPALKFPAGAVFQFEWTPNNVKAVATPVDCPVCPDDGDSGGGGTTDPSCTVLVPGCGIALRTNEQGQLVIELASTGVEPGDYGGLRIDECGRVSGIDAMFPASALPVFDPCCESGPGCDTVAGGD